MSQPLVIDAAFTPGEVQSLSRKVCIVVDVIRSSSTLAVIMSRNPGQVILTPTVQKAQKFASQQKVHPVLCGERGGLPPEGFDYGNSPREYLNVDLSGKTVIFTSSNGTRAIADIAMAPHVLMGSFLNSSKVVEEALSIAQGNGLDIMVVCAGREEKFALDDAYCAGHLIARLAGSLGVDQPFTLADGGQAALAIWGYYRDPEKLLRQSGSGVEIEKIGLGEDLSFLTRLDTFSCVPSLINRGNPNPPHGFSILL